MNKISHTLIVGIGQPSAWQRRLKESPSFTLMVLALGCVIVTVGIATQNTNYKVSEITYHRKIITLNIDSIRPLSCTNW